MLEMVNSIFSYSVEMFAYGKEEHLKDIIRLENEIDEFLKLNPNFSEKSFNL